MGNTLGCDSICNHNYGKENRFRSGTMLTPLLRSACVLPHKICLQPFPLDPTQHTRVLSLSRNEFLEKFTERAPEIKKRGVAPHAGPPVNENGEGTRQGRPKAFAPVIIGGAQDAGFEGHGVQIHTDKSHNDGSTSQPLHQSVAASNCRRMPFQRDATDAEMLGTARDNIIPSPFQMSEPISSDDNLQAVLSREIDEIRSRCLSVLHRPFQFRSSHACFRLSLALPLLPFIPVRVFDYSWVCFCV